MQTCRRPASFHFDDDYLRRLGSGDGPTGQHFATHFGRFLGWRLGARYCDLELIEDLRQETLRRVLEAIHQGLLRDASSLEPFAGSVCNRVLLEYWRSARKHTHAVIDVEEIAGPSNPEGSYGRREALGRVLTAMQSLPARDRDVLSIFFLEDRDAGEVGLRMRVSRNYARVLLHRALGRLRELC